jgi:hypothetical protein
MTTLNLELAKDILNKFALSNEEMICVRGGDMDGEPIIKTTPPPVRI